MSKPNNIYTSHNHNKENPSTMSIAKNLTILKRNQEIILNINQDLKSMNKGKNLHLFGKTRLIRADITTNLITAKSTRRKGTVLKGGMQRKKMSLKWCITREKEVPRVLNITRPYIRSQNSIWVVKEAVLS